MGTAFNKSGNLSQLWLLLAAAGGALLIWYALDVFLLGFAGILLGIFLHSLAALVCRYTVLSRGWSLLLAVLFLLSAFGAMVWYLAPSVAAQIDNLTESLPRALDRLQGNIRDYEWGRTILGNVPDTGEIVPNAGPTLSTATSYFSSTLESAGRFIIVLFVGLFLAVEPKTYLGGVRHLIPPGKRERAAEVIEQIGHDLQRWIVGKVISMIFIGVLTWAGLWFLDVPLAMTLGIIAALFTFIPNIGPLISLVPAALLALLESPTKALYVVAFFAVVQTVESYLLTPLLQKRAVSLPPALTIIVQVLMGVVAGGIGLILATPLLVVTLVVVRMLYVEDVLHKNSSPERSEEKGLSENDAEGAVGPKGTKGGISSLAGS